MFLLKNRLKYSMFYHFLGKNIPPPLVDTREGTNLTFSSVNLLGSLAP